MPEAFLWAVFGDFLTEFEPGTSILSSLALRDISVTKKVPDQFYGDSKALEKASHCTKSNRRKKEAYPYRVSTELILRKLHEIVLAEQSLFFCTERLLDNGASITYLKESHQPIRTLNEKTYVPPPMVQNFWL